MTSRSSILELNFHTRVGNYLLFTFFFSMSTLYPVIFFFLVFRHLFDFGGNVFPVYCGKADNGY